MYTFLNQASIRLHIHIYAQHLATAQIYHQDYKQCMSFSHHTPYILELGLSIDRMTNSLNKILLYMSILYHLI